MTPPLATLRGAPGGVASLPRRPATALPASPHLQRAAAMVTGGGVRARLGSRLGVAAALVVAALACACTEVPELPAGVCGNRVVEAGEDCDGYAEPGATCGVSGTDNECAYICDTGGAVCLEGWQCGADGRCRAPSGTFVAAPSSPLNFPVNDSVAIGDVDGDGFPDVIGSRSSQLSLRFGGADGSFSDALDFQVPEPVSPVLFLPFDRDQRLDVLVPITAGLFNLLGDISRDLAPVSYASDSLTPGDRVRMLALEAYDGGDPDRDRDREILFLTGDGMWFSDARMSEADTDIYRPYPDDYGVAGLGDSVAVGDLDGDGLSEFVLPFRGAPGVYVCDGQDPADEPDLRVQCGASIAVPTPVDTFGAQLADTDGDGDLDLLVSVEAPDDGSSADDTPQVAHLLNEGGSLVGAAKADFFTTFASRQTGSAWPLASADFDGNGDADYVFDDRIVVVDDVASGPPVDGFTAVEATTGRWNAAVITDINGDGRDDVVVSVEGLNGLDAFVTVAAPGGQVAFNKFHLDTERPPALLRAGDFDGDLVGDVAFAELRFGGGVDRVSVVFGSKSGGPSAPTAMATFPTIEALEPIVSAVGINGFDLIDDLAVVSSKVDGTDAARSVTILRGDSSRRMVSPFFLAGAAADVFERPVGVVVGDFLVGDEANSPGRDIVTIARHDDDDIDSVSAWLLDGVDIRGELAQGLTSASLTLADSQFDYACAQWLAGDIDGDGADEVVGIDYRDGCDRSSDLVDGGSPGACVVVLDEVAAAAPLPAECEPIAGGYRDLRSAALRDLDADDDLDLLLLFAGQLDDGDDQTQPSDAAIVLRNQGDGSWSEPEVLAPATELYSAAAIELDGDENAELVILAEGQIYTADAASGDDRYDSFTSLQDQNGDGRIVVSDINRDGLDDIIYNIGASLHLLLHVPQAPLGGRAATNSVTGATASPVTGAAADPARGAGR